MPLTEEELKDVGERWINGEPISRLSKEFEMSDTGLRYQIDKAGYKRSTPATPAEFHQIVICENKEQTYRQNLRWAIDAAGDFHRTGHKPKGCPNNSAWFLYVQAVKDPKDFLGKIGQVESKGEDDPNKELRIFTQHSIEEIDVFLESLQQEESKE
jgi:hypothetical protein